MVIQLRLRVAHLRFQLREEMQQGLAVRTRRVPHAQRVRKSRHAAAPVIQVEWLPSFAPGRARSAPRPGKRWLRTLCPGPADAAGTKSAYSAWRVPADRPRIEPSLEYGCSGHRVRPRRTPPALKALLVCAAGRLSPPLWPLARPRSRGGYRGAALMSAPPRLRGIAGVCRPAADSGCSPYGRRWMRGAGWECLSARERQFRTGRSRTSQRACQGSGDRCAFTDRLAPSSGMRNCR
jgi:hypothetical protein